MEIHLFQLAFNFLLRKILQPPKNGFFRRFLALAYAVFIISATGRIKLRFFGSSGLGLIFFSLGSSFRWLNRLNWRNGPFSHSRQNLLLNHSRSWLFRQFQRRFLLKQIRPRLSNHIQHRTRFLLHFLARIYLQSFHAFFWFRGLQNLAWVRSFTLPRLRLRFVLRLLLRLLLRLVLRPIRRQGLRHYRGLQLRSIHFRQYILRVFLMFRYQRLLLEHLQLYGFLWLVRGHFYKASCEHVLNLIL